MDGHRTVNGLKELYLETIKRHAADPVGYRRSIEATHRCEGHNAQCGDRVDIRLRLRDGHIEDIAFEGEACAICMASASLMCENLAGRPIERLGELKSSLGSALESQDKAGDAGPLSPLLGVKPYPSRIQCATLPWETAEKALERKNGP